MMPAVKEEFPLVTWFDKNLANGARAARQKAYRPVIDELARRVTVWIKTHARNHPDTDWSSLPCAVSPEMTQEEIKALLFGNPVDNGMPNNLPLMVISQLIAQHPEQYASNPPVIGKTKKILYEPITEVLCQDLENFHSYLLCRGSLRLTAEGSSVINTKYEPDNVPVWQLNPAREKMVVTVAPEDPESGRRSSIFYRTPDRGMDGLYGGNVVTYKEMNAYGVSEEVLLLDAALYTAWEMQQNAPLATKKKPKEREER